VHFINSLEDYVTTSSCSGRIAVYKDTHNKGVDWLVVIHGMNTIDIL
jgi:tRNA(Phe) wybutosine-synthesizing methylase Tyw3